jgi:hypothetical protein
MPATDPTKHINVTLPHEGIEFLTRVQVYLRDRYGRAASKAARANVSIALNSIRKELETKEPQA